MSVYERIERMQEKDPRKIYCGEFSADPKSGINIPGSRFRPVGRKVRIMLHPDDE